MYKQERVVGGRLGADSADVEEWCGVFLEDLEGLDAPGVERSPATPGGEMGQYGTRSLDEAHPLVRCTRRAPPRRARSRAQT